MIKIHWKNSQKTIIYIISYYISYVIYMYMEWMTDGEMERHRERNWSTFIKDSQLFSLPFEMFCGAVFAQHSWAHPIHQQHSKEKFKPQILYVAMVFHINYTFDAIQGRNIYIGIAAHLRWISSYTHSSSFQ